MEFHRSGWFFKCQTNGIPSIWSLKFQNALHPSTLSVNWAELHFQPLGHLSNGFQGKKPERITFKKLFFPIWKLTLSENHSHNVAKFKVQTLPEYVKAKGQLKGERDRERRVLGVLSFKLKTIRPVFCWKKTLFFRFWKGNDLPHFFLSLNLPLENLANCFLTIIV